LNFGHPPREDWKLYPIPKYGTVWNYNNEVEKRARENIRRAIIDRIFELFYDKRWRYADIAEKVLNHLIELEKESGRPFAEIAEEKYNKDSNSYWKMPILREVEEVKIIQPQKIPEQITTPTDNESKEDNEKSSSPPLYKKKKKLLKKKPTK
jgi:hypothetical protein